MTERNPTPSAPIRKAALVLALLLGAGGVATGALLSIPYGAALTFLASATLVYAFASGSHQQTDD